MAQTHNALNASLLGKAIRSALGIRDGVSTIERFGETLDPVIDLWGRPEWAILRGERLWAASPSQGAVAGEFSTVGVYNPTDSGLIVVVEGFALASSAANHVLYARLGQNVSFTATGLPQSRDSRLFSQTGLQVTAFSHHSAAVIGNGLLQWTQSSTNYIMPFVFTRMPVILSPGYFFGLQDGAGNTAFQADFIGYQRVAQRGELDIGG